MSVELSLHPPTVAPPTARGKDAPRLPLTFKQRCRGLGIKGVTLHSYRYAWVGRAKQCGYPERFAQEALGHNSQAVHRAYARQAKVILPPLESFQKESRKANILLFAAPINRS